MTAVREAHGVVSKGGPVARVGPHSGMQHGWRHAADGTGVTC
jgi:hypothetical protein